MSSDGRLPERFDPILRELLTEHLAIRQKAGEEGTDPSGWVLTEAVQRRLEELGKAAPDPAKVALYFGHHCAVCQQSVATRRVEGRFVCSACTTDNGKQSPAETSGA